MIARFAFVCAIYERALVSATGIGVLRLKHSMATTEPLVLSRTEDGIGEVTLNRPHALNSLNLEMVTLLHDIYHAWSAPGSGVNAVLLTGAGEKAFCAGGDVKHVASQVMSNQYDAAMAFFKQEYLTDATISQLQLPHISLLDGITMGGGAGVSMHGHFRVATERTVFAMPECTIGLFPDVGMMAHLPHLPGELGAYLALTGARLTGIQLKEAGLATHYIPSSYLNQVKQRLRQAGPAAADLSFVNNLLNDLEAVADAQSSASGTRSSLSSRMPIISRCFGHNSVCRVVAALQAEKAEKEWCKETLQQLHRGSPLSAAVTLSYYQRSRSQRLSPVECLEQDAVLCGHFMAGDGDFAEGVRARLIDKDDKPQWKHRSHSEVPAELVERFFKPRSQLDVIDLHDALGKHRSSRTTLSKL